MSRGWREKGLSDRLHYQKSSTGPVETSYTRTSATVPINVSYHAGSSSRSMEQPNTYYWHQRIYRLFGRQNMGFYQRVVLALGHLALAQVGIVGYQGLFLRSLVIRLTWLPSVVLVFLALCFFSLLSSSNYPTSSFYTVNESQRSCS